LGIDVNEKIKSSARILDANYIPPRYPDAYPAGSPHEYYDKESADKSKKSAELIREFVEEIVRKYA
jgi:HEPN domain-containing protein